MFQILATAWVLQTDLIVYWQYWNMGGWIRYKYGPESNGRGGSFLCQAIQGGERFRTRFHCEPLPDFPEPEYVITKLHRESVSNPRVFCENKHIMIRLRTSVRVRGPVVDPWEEEGEQGACGSSSAQP